MTLLYLLSLVTLVAAQQRLFERVRLPAEWSLSGSAPAHFPLKLEFGLHNHRQAELEDIIGEVSDPDHPKYGQHLSYEELQYYARPSNDAVHAVTEWLSRQEIKGYSFDASDAFVTVDLSVKQAEKLLGTEFSVFTHRESGNQAVRTLETHLPDAVHPHIAVIAPTTYFGHFHEIATTSHLVETHSAADNANADPCPRGGCSNSVQKHCNPNRVTPACIRSLYGVDYTPKVPKKQTLGVLGYLEQFANYRDLALFQHTFARSTPNLNFSVELVNRGQNPQDLKKAGGEADLDVQYTTSLTHPIPNTFFSVGGSPPFKADATFPTNTNEPYLNFLKYILRQKKLPSVITTSYVDDEQTVPKSYARKVCSLYAQLTSRGVSVIHGSGDGGTTGGQVDGYCYKNDGHNTTRYLPTFPASCPYVTGVGATMPSPIEGFAEEIVAPFSTGGFSDYFPIPKWQSSAVNTYIRKSGVTKTAKNLFNPKGRGIPDVSLIGTNYAVVSNGVQVAYYGTSCSAPTFASLITLLNDKRIAEGKPVLGFLNPWLYKTGKAAFNPVTTGYNAGCGEVADCVPTNCLLNGKPLPGFPAKTGWSPSTGLGVPNFKKLFSLV